MCSGMGGSRNSCIAIASASLAISRRLRAGDARLGLELALDSLRAEGVCRFLGGCVPSPSSSELTMLSCSCSWNLTSRAWSAMRCVLLVSISFSKCSTWLLSSRFSDSIRAQSFSSSRILCDWLTLILAISRFCRRNLRLTGQNRGVSLRAL